MSLIEIENLKIVLPGKKKERQEIVHGISFSIEEGEIFGLVGESGSGKSMTALSLLNLLPQGAEFTANRMEFHVPWNSSECVCKPAAKGRTFISEKEYADCEVSFYNYKEDLLTKSEREWKELRGNQISIVFQEPMTSLNPVLTIGKQVEEGLLLHEPDTYRNRELRRKRVLEVLSEANLKDSEQLLEKYPHQLSGGMRQRVMIAMAMLCHPKLLIADEPTTALDAATQEAVISLLSKYRKDYGVSILFISHDLSLVQRICDRVAVMKDGVIVEQGKKEEIFLHPAMEYTKQLLFAGNIPFAGFMQKSRSDSEELLRLTAADIVYTEVSSFGKRIEKETVRDISFSLHRGEILGLVGESGSGKSTIAKAATGLLPLKKGELWLSPEAGRPQMVFQDPYGSLNPAKKISWILEEPLKIQRRFSKKERKRLVIEALKEVELEEVYLNRYVRELSGGQRQRVAIAAALIQKPDIVVLDEPVSALDVTVQRQILELLYHLKQEHGMSYLFVSHDMRVVKNFCDRILVLYRGEVVEEGETDRVFLHPKHPYTRELMECRGSDNKSWK